MLIAIDNQQQSVMHYLADDTSDAAIAAEVARTYGRAIKWRRITQAEYAAIRASRPKPPPALVDDNPQAVNVAQVNDALAAMAHAIGVVNAKIEALADSVVRTDIVGTD